MQAHTRLLGLRLTTSSLALVATFATALAGCGGAVSSKDHSVISEVEGDGGWTADSPASEDGGNAPDAPYVYGTDCGAILYVPPVITVQLSSPSPAGCDATFSTYDPTSHTVGATIDATLCNGAPKDWGCPASTTEIPAGACVYALGGFEGTGSVSVLVSEPGYVPAQIDDVSGGEAGCATPVASTQAAVTLQQAELSAGGAKAE